MPNGSSPHQTTRMALAVCQAIRQYKTKGTYARPPGFRPVAALGTRAFPYLGYVMESRSEMVIAFRGTESPLDIVSDFNWSLVKYPFAGDAGQTHRGFTAVYSTVVRRQILEALRSRSPRKVLRIAGHSLGGALAVLCALDVATNLRQRTPRVYTFGSPKTGDQTFAAAYGRLVPQTTRVYNTYDIVPYFPISTAARPYRHVGRDRPITFSLAGPLQNHKMENYYEALLKTGP